MLSKIKQYIKHLRDDFYSVNISGKESIGREDIWTILTNQLHCPIVYSGGVGKNVSFETELIRRFQANVFCFDPTETGIKTIQSLSSGIDIHFFPVALSDRDGTIELHLPVNKDEGSYTKGIHQSQQTLTRPFACRSIPSLMNELGHAKIDILKLDIEGAEYEVLTHVLDENIEFDQLCVEFHHFFKGISKRQTMDMIHRLRSAGYRMFHKRELDYSFYRWR